MSIEQAVKMIQDRIEEMVSNSAVQARMLAMKGEGRTNEEIRAWLQAAAVATLCGN